VITGGCPDSPDGGEDDLVTAQLIERARLKATLEIAATRDAVANSAWAHRMSQMDVDDVHPDDVSIQSTSTDSTSP
jgi:hypothetical protein